MRSLQALTAIGMVALFTILLVVVGMAIAPADDAGGVRPIMVGQNDAQTDDRRELRPRSRAGSDPPAEEKTESSVADGRVLVSEPVHVRGTVTGPVDTGPHDTPEARPQGEQPPATTGTTPSTVRAPAEEPRHSTPTTIARTMPTSTPSTSTSPPQGHSGDSDVIGPEPRHQGEATAGTYGSFESGGGTHGD